VRVAEICQECERLMSRYSEAASWLAQEEQNLARHRPAENGEFERLWEACSEARSALEAIRTELIKHVQQHGRTLRE
jgi:hypothetical protein